MLDRWAPALDDAGWADLRVDLARTARTGYPLDLGESGPEIHAVRAAIRGPWSRLSGRPPAGSTR